MTCPRCAGDNSEGRRYCGDCGALLAPAPSAPTDPATMRLRDEIRAAVKEQVKDQKMLEIETAAAVVTRVSEWVKLIGIFAAVPLALLAATLILLGVNSYNDFTAKVKTAREDVDKNLDATQARAKVLQAQVEKEYAEIAKRFSDNKVLAARLDELGSQVDQIGRKVGVTFKSSPDLTQAVQSQLQQTLDAYQTYLERLGVRMREGRISLEVGGDNISNAYYVIHENKIVIGRKFLDDRHVILREYTHHVLCSTVDCRGNRFQESFESAMADYLPCSFLDDPKLAQRMAQALQLPAGYIRNLDNAMRLDAGALAKYQVPHQMGEALGGAFWEVRRLIGKERADRALFEIWLSFKGADAKAFSASELGRRILAQVQQHDGASADRVRTALLGRGLAL
jgi:hypothetical protein